MITYEIGRAQVVEGKWNEAVEWDKEFGDYFRANGWNAGRTLQPLEDGLAGNIVWVFEFESLANYEKWYETIHADAGVTERLVKMDELFVAESMSFVAYKQVL